MSERLTDERIDTLDAARVLPGEWAEWEEYERDGWFESFGRAIYEPLAALLTEVRERRAQDGAAMLVCDGYTAAHRERDVLRARVAELEAALRECVADNDGLFSLGVQAETWDHGSGDEAIAAKVDAEERALAILDRARAALAKGESK